jgi:hypothetical protein
VVIAAYHPVSEKQIWAADCDEEVGFFVQGCDAEDCELCCGCGPVSAKCRLVCDLWTSRVVCSDLCCATDAEVSDQAHNCHWQLAGCVLCLLLGAEEDFLHGEEEGISCGRRPS